MFRRSKRTIPVLNTTSTADISFMLLIFFLVTTSMDIDKGITRQLPPTDSKKEITVTDVAKENVMRIVMKADGSLVVDDNPTDISALRKLAEGFLASSKNLSEHVISVDVDRKASYDAYFNMQNEVVAAYHTVRDALAKSRYDHLFDACTENERQEVIRAIPQRIAEVYHTDFQGEEEGGSE
ncbi:MAG: biopolymer transporter ExbD [Prevotella sp.]|nr:biopolymer transporter ExbD [Prevotella sp.]